MVLGVEVSSNSLGNSEEVSHVDAVGDVGVKVIFEMLEHVHVLLDITVSSNSIEGEGLIVEFPGVDGESWCSSGVLLDGIGNIDGVGPVSWIEGS